MKDERKEDSVPDFGQEPKWREVLHEWTGLIVAEAAQYDPCSCTTRKLASSCVAHRHRLDWEYRKGESLSWVRVGDNTLGTCHKSAILLLKAFTEGPLRDNKMEIWDHMDSVRTREDLIKFLSLLREDSATRQDETENLTLDDYLKALAVLIHDCEEEDPDSKAGPTWHELAAFLFYARTYE